MTPVCCACLHWKRRHLDRGVCWHPEHMRGGFAVLMYADEGCEDFVDRLTPESRAALERHTEKGER